MWKIAVLATGLTSGCITVVYEARDEAVEKPGDAGATPHDGDVATNDAATSTDAATEADATAHLFDGGSTDIACVPAVHVGCTCPECPVCASETPSAACNRCLIACTSH